MNDNDLFDVLQVLDGLLSGVSSIDELRAKIRDEKEFAHKRCVGTYIGAVGRVGQLMPVVGETGPGGNCDVGPRRLPNPVATLCAKNHD